MGGVPVSQLLACCLTAAPFILTKIATASLDVCLSTSTGHEVPWQSHSLCGTIVMVSVTQSFSQSIISEGRPLMCKHCCSLHSVPLNRIGFFLQVERRARRR